VRLDVAGGAYNGLKARRFRNGNHLLEALAMRLALYQPDIAQNAGTILRLAACLGVAVDVIEPCGFPFDDRRMRRAGMDYLDQVDLTRHSSWQAYRESEGMGRLVLLTTNGDTVFPDLVFRPTDTLMVGQESAGVPGEVHDAADLRLRIPLLPGMRSINVALAAAIVLSEALRQTKGFPAP
jgi:tRNA (cytidine/uridine-2'-O-)-methyltransferase